jgi:hypothetical protein
MRVSWTFGQVGASNRVERELEREARASRRTGERAKMKAKDESRKWMWMFLAGLVSLQVYFVWELLAVFALFAVGFAVLAFGAGSLYMLHRGWALAVDRVADSRHPIMVATRQGIYAIEDAARRPFRRPGSAPAR